MTTRIVQDGESTIFGTYEEFYETFYDVSSNSFIIQQQSTPGTRADRLLFSTTQAVFDNGDTVFANGTGVIVGHTAQITGATVAEFQVLGTAAADSSIIIGRFSADANPPTLQFVKSRDPVIADGSFGIVVNNDVVGRIIYTPDDGADFATEAADFRVIVDDGSPAAGDVGILLFWRSMPGGGGAIEEKFRLTAGGQAAFHQQAAAGIHLSLRSSDVATVVSSIVKGPSVGTNDYFGIGKIAATTGGAHIIGIAESGASEAIHIEGWAGAPNTADDHTGTLGCINIFGGQHDGSNGDVDMAVNSNLLVVGEIDSSNARQARLALKADDGELHIDDTTLVDLSDTLDDVMLVRALHLDAAPPNGGGVVESMYDPQNPFNDYKLLRSMGLVGPRSEDGHALYPLQPRIKLHEGALWQLFNDVMDVAQALPEDAQKKLSGRMQGRLALVA
jgi:hypothetical protein